MDAQNVPSSLNWFDKLVKQFNLEKFDISTNRLIEIGIYLGIGFVTGFLLKRCFTYVFIALLTLVGLFVLHQFDIITITMNTAKLQELFSIKQTVTVDTNLLVVYWEWIKLNIAIVLSFSIGLIIGLRVG